MGNPYKNQKKPTVAPRATTAQAVFVPPPPQPSAPLRSMDQERAEFALKKIQAILGGADQTHKAEVRRYLNNLPALIRMNGLGQALAFFLTKKKKNQKTKTLRTKRSTTWSAPGCATPAAKAASSAKAPTPSAP